MDELAMIPSEVGGRTWQKGDYDFETEFGWQTPFQEDDYAEGVTKADYDDISITGGDVPHYFIYVQKDGEGSFTTTLTATNGPRVARSGMASPYGDRPSRHAESIEKAQEDVLSMMKHLG
jgi:hypothetical protein